jgi:phospholipase/carboxylesterase
MMPRTPPHHHSILTLKFMLHSELIPAVEPNSKHLMVMLHGLGDSIEGYRWLPEALRLPWLNYLLVNAPDDYCGGYSWFNLEGDIASGVHRSRKLLFAVLDAQRAQGFPTEQTTLGGFSQGCLMTIDAGLHYPHRFAGLVGISGWVCEAEKVLKELTPLAKEQRFLITHGTHDPVVAFERTRKQIQFAKGAGLNIAWHEFAKPHTIAGEEEMRVIRDFVKTGAGK